MKITWYGTASILLQTDRTDLLFDPYMKDLPKGAEPMEKTADRIDAFKRRHNVFITHGHFDHLSSVKKIFNDLPCTVYLTKTPRKTLMAQKFSAEKLSQIEIGGCTEIDGVSVRALQGKHVKFLRKDIFKSTFGRMLFRQTLRKIRLSMDFLKYPEKGETVFYEVEAEGKIIQIMGSADLLDGVNYRTGADVLILPHQGRSDIDAHNKKIVEKLQPKRVLLDHYDNAFPPFSADVSVDGFCAEISKIIPTQKLIEGVAVEI